MTAKDPEDWGSVPKVGAKDIYIKQLEARIKILERQVRTFEKMYKGIPF